MDELAGRISINNFCCAFKMIIQHNSTKGKEMKKILFLSAGLFIFQAVSTQAQSTTKISGLVFADYYYNVENNKPALVDESAFTFRRIYFTFENNLTENIKTRIRFESAHDKFGEGSKINPFVKHAYLEWSNLIPNHKLYAGIEETNAFKNTEELWGYRSIEKTIMDLNKICFSADMGIALKGDLSVKVHHWLTVMNGTGYGSSEVDRFKKIGYAFWVNPVKELTLEAYADYEKQDPDKPDFEYATDYSGSSGYHTIKGFIGWDAPSFTLGAEAFLRTNMESGIENVTLAGDTAVAGYAKADVKRFGCSVFGSWITPVPKLKLFARYDFFDPNTENAVFTDFSDGQLSGGLDDETSLIIAGLDYIPGANIHVMPNILFKSYSKEGKDSDLTVRMTLHYKFDSGNIIVE